MFKLFQSIRRYLTIPLGILIVGILTFLFGPGQCSKRPTDKASNSKFEKIKGNDYEVKQANKNVINSHNPKNQTQQLKKTSTVGNLDRDIDNQALIDSVLNYKHIEIRSFISKYGIDSAINVLHSAKFSNISNEERELINNIIKNLLIEKEYDVDQAYRNVAPGLVIIEKDEKYGFIDKKGNIIHKPTFIDIEPLFFHPFTAIQRSSGWGFIDSFGIITVQVIYDSIDVILDSDKYCKLIKNEEIDIFDLEKGRFKFQNLKTFDRIWANHIIINRGRKYGLFDLEFNRLIKGDYDEIELIDGADDYYIKVTNKSKSEYYNLSIDKIPNPIIN